LLANLETTPVGSSGQLRIFPHGDALADFPGLNQKVWWQSRRATLPCSPLHNCFVRDSIGCLAYCSGFASAGPVDQHFANAGGTERRFLDYSIPELSAYFLGGLFVDIVVVTKARLAERPLSFQFTAPPFGSLVPLAVQPQLSHAAVGSVGPRGVARMLLPPRYLLLRPKSTNPADPTAEFRHLGWGCSAGCVDAPSESLRISIRSRVRARDQAARDISSWRRK
jgi:hypothetical protein